MIDSPFSMVKIHEKNQGNLYLCRNGRAVTLWGAAFAQTTAKPAQVPRNASAARSTTKIVALGNTAATLGNYVIFCVILWNSMGLFWGFYGILWDKVKVWDSMGLRGGARRNSSPPEAGTQHFNGMLAANMGLFTWLNQEKCCFHWSTWACKCWIARPMGLYCQKFLKMDYIYSGLQLQQLLLLNDMCGWFTPLALAIFRNPRGPKVVTMLSSKWKKVGTPRLAMS